MVAHGIYSLSMASIQATRPKCKNVHVMKFWRTLNSRSHKLMSSPLSRTSQPLHCFTFSIGGIENVWFQLLFVYKKGFAGSLHHITAYNCGLSLCGLLPDNAHRLHKFNSGSNISVHCFLYTAQNTEHCNIMC